jgi:hypothetical protein
MTSKQHVLKKYPKAKCRWIPGWGLYEVEANGRCLATGFNAPTTWKTAAKKL